MADYNEKTDWLADDPVTEGDFNRWEQGIADAHMKGDSAQETADQNETDISAHISENPSDGVHGMGSVASEDYEEGTFTPLIEGLTTAGDNTYNVQEGRYTKIGNIVFFSLEVRMGTKDTNMAGELVVSGLPFVCNGNTSVSIGRVDHIAFSTERKGIFGFIRNSDQYIRLNESIDSGDYRLLDSSQSDDGTLFFASGTYQIN